MRSKNGLSSPFTTIASVLSSAEAVPANSSSANAPSTPVIFMDVLLVRIGGSRRPPGATIRRFAAIRAIHFAQCLTIAQLTRCPPHPTAHVGRGAVRQRGPLRQPYGRPIDAAGRDASNAFLLGRTSGDAFSAEIGGPAACPYSSSSISQRVSVRSKPSLTSR